MLKEELYDDHNYYMRFITSQIEWRQKVEKHIDYKDQYFLENLYQWSMINAYGLRGSGATTAIAEIFDPSKDLYIGINSGCCKTFQEMINIRLKRNIKDKIHYLNFNNINFDNTNVNVDDLIKKMGSFLDENNIEVLQHRVDYKTQKPKLKQLEIDDLLDDVKDMLFHRLGHDGDYHELNRERGRMHGLKNTVVYIDIGTQNQREYSIRVNRMINYICGVIVPDQAKNIIFVLT